MARVTFIDGTPDEIVEVMKKAGMLASAADPALIGDDRAMAAAPTVADDHKEKVFATNEFARRVLSRRPLSNEQRGVLILLAKTHPKWVSAADLQAAVNYTPAQFAGLMGAFGRRITHTDGFVEGSWFFDAVWNYDLGCYLYRLPETVRAAVKQEKIG